MSKQHKFSPAPNEDSISHLLLTAYMTGYQAVKQDDQELADLMACHIFDLLDWVRRHQADFQIDLAKLALQNAASFTPFMGMEEILPTSIQELESFVDAHFYCNQPPIDPGHVSAPSTEQTTLC